MTETKILFNGNLCHVIFLVAILCYCNKIAKYLSIYMIHREIFMANCVGKVIPFNEGDAP